jgi:hypothetical protein
MRLIALLALPSCVIYGNPRSPRLQRQSQGYQPGVPRIMRRFWMALGQIVIASMTGLLAPSSVRACQCNPDILWMTVRSVTENEQPMAASEWEDVRVTVGGTPARVLLSIEGPIASEDLWTTWQGVEFESDDLAKKADRRVLPFGLLALALPACYPCACPNPST